MTCVNVTSSACAICSASCIWRPASWWPPTSYTSLQDLPAMLPLIQMVVVPVVERRASRCGSRRGYAGCSGAIGRRSRVVGPPSGRLAGYRAWPMANGTPALMPDAWTTPLRQGAALAAPIEYDSHRRFARAVR